MALFSGPNGPSFQVAADMACFAKGTRLALLSYPNEMDEELSTENTPAIDNGVVCQVRNIERATCCLQARQCIVRQHFGRRNDSAFSV